MKESAGGGVPRRLTWETVAESCGRQPLSAVGRSRRPSFSLAAGMQCCDPRYVDQYRDGCSRLRARKHQSPFGRRTAEAAVPTKSVVAIIYFRTRSLVASINLNSRATAFHQGGVLVDGYIGEPLNATTRQGPLHLHPVDPATSADTKNDTGIMRGKITSAPGLVNRAFQVSRLPRNLCPDAIWIRLLRNKFDPDPVIAPSGIVL